MKYIMCSRHFQKGHPKAGEQTHFVEKILLGLLQAEEITIGRCIELARQVFDKDHPMCSYNAIRAYDCQPFKGHTIRPGSRFKPGDMASLRVWSGAPYRSKQIEFAQVEVKNVWSFNIHVVDDDLVWQVPGFGSGSFDTKSGGLQIIASHDGLEIRDFIDWFNIHPKAKGQAFTGQIIFWNESINY